MNKIDPLFRRANSILVLSVTAVIAGGCSMTQSKKDIGRGASGLTTQEQQLLEAGFLHVEEGAQMLAKANAAAMSRYQGYAGIPGVDTDPDVYAQKKRLEVRNRVLRELLELSRQMEDEAQNIQTSHEHQPPRMD